MKSCGGSSLKYLLFVSNIIFFIFSIVMIVLGALTIVGANNVYFFARFKPIGILVVVGGSILFVTTFLGCCGAISENRFMLITYAVLVSILALLNIVLLILIHTMRFDWIDNEDNGKRRMITKDTIAILLGTAAAIEIIGTVLASVMASNIRAKGHHIECQEVVQLKMK